MGRLHASYEGMQSGAWVPPPEMQLWNAAQEKLETPLDARGMVDLDELVKVTKQTVDGEYDWTSPFNDVHHLQWPNAAYEDTTEHDFRELARRKAYLPRKFHNWVHVVTEPPPLPTKEAMRHAIRAERTARMLAATARLAVILSRNKMIPEKKQQLRLEQEFEKYTIYVENAREVPREFQLLKLEEVEAHSVDEMLAANKRLGKLALSRIPVRNRLLFNAG